MHTNEQENIATKEVEIEKKAKTINNSVCHLFT
jgi:uncharacterized protein YfkK (UPF0435 family)